MKVRDDDIQGRRGASPPRPAEVRSLERRRLQTLVEADIAAALSLHASDYQLITPNGEPVSRDEYLGMIGRREFVYDVFQPASDIAVRAYGEVVAVRYQGPDRSSLERRERSRVVLAHGYLRAARWALAGSVVSGDADRGADLLASGGVLLTSPSAPFPTRVPTVCKPRPAPHHSRNGCRPGHRQLGYGRNGR